MSEIEKMQEAVKDVRMLITQIQMKVDYNNTMLNCLTLNRLNVPTTPVVPKKNVNCCTFLWYVIGALAAINMALFTLVIVYWIFYYILLSIFGKQS